MESCRKKFLGIYPKAPNVFCAHKSFQCICKASLIQLLLVIVLMTMTREQLSFSYRCLSGVKNCMRLATEIPHPPRPSPLCLWFPVPSLPMVLIWHAINLMALLAFGMLTIVKLFNVSRYTRICIGFASGLKDTCGYFAPAIARHHLFY